MDRAQQILNDCTHDVKNEFNEDNRDLTNLMDMGKNFCVVKVLNDQVNINCVDISKDGYNARVMHITIIIVFSFITIGTIVLNEVVVVGAVEYANLGLRQIKTMRAHQELCG